MAQPIICDGPDLEVALYIVTNTDTADVLAFCPTCFADFCQAYMQAVAPERLAPAPKPPARKSRRKPATAVADDTSGGAQDGTAATAPAG